MPFIPLESVERAAMMAKSGLISKCWVALVLGWYYHGQPTTMLDYSLQGYVSACEFCWVIF